MTRDVDRRLSKVQLKEAYDLAASMGLDTSGFEVTEVQGKEGFTVTEFRHPETTAFIVFDWDARYVSGRIVRWWPSHDGELHSESAETWSPALALFKLWLTLAKG